MITYMGASDQQWDLLRTYDDDVDNDNCNKLSMSDMVL